MKLQLREKLKNSDLSDMLFEYLAVRLESEKLRFVDCEIVEPYQNARAKELKVLLNLFEPA